MISHRWSKLSSIFKKFFFILWLNNFKSLSSLSQIFLFIGRAESKLYLQKDLEKFQENQIKASLEELCFWDPLNSNKRKWKAWVLDTHILRGLFSKTTAGLSACFLPPPLRPRGPLMPPSFLIPGTQPAPFKHKCQPPATWNCTSNCPFSFPTWFGIQAEGWARLVPDLKGSSDAVPWG